MLLDHSPYPAAEHGQRHLARQRRRRGEDPLETGVPGLLGDGLADGQVVVDELLLGHAESLLHGGVG